MKSCDCRKRAPRDRGHHFVYDVNEHFQAARDFPQRQTLLLQLDGLYLTSTDKAEVMTVAGRNCKFHRDRVTLNIDQTLFLLVCVFTQIGN